VKDASKVDDNVLKQTGASGVIRKGEGVQIIYGPQVAVIKSNLEDYMAHPGEEKTKKSSVVIGAHLSGTVVPVEKVEDEVFSQKILGDGVAIEPSDGKLFAPCDGRVEKIFDSKHAINIVSDNGCEILLHIGIDTVKLGGKYFTVRAKEGQKIKKGELLISFDTKSIRDNGYKLVTPMIICNSDEYENIEILHDGKIDAGTDLIKAE